MESFNMSVAMVQEECVKCHTAFTMTKQLNEQLRKSCDTFYCPQGHPMSYRAGHSNLDRANKELHERVEELEENVRLVRQQYHDATRARWQMMNGLIKYSQVGQSYIRPAAVRSLLSHGLCTFEALSKSTMSELLCMNNIGAVTLNHIMNLLSEAGLHLKAPEEE